MAEQVAHADMHSILGEFVSKLPIYQYSFLPAEGLVFDERLRIFCRHNCPHFKTSWSCPPACGSVERCKERCLSYDEALFFSSIDRADGPDGSGEEPYIDQHEHMTGLVEACIEQNGLQTYTLTSNVCRACRRCTYPKKHCAHPEILRPCIESHCISISDLTRRVGMDVFIGKNRPLRFSIVLYKHLTSTIR